MHSVNVRPVAMCGYVFSEAQHVQSRDIVSDTDIASCHFIFILEVFVAPT